MKQNDIQNVPLFSIITVVLNDASGLKKTLESVYNQSYTNFEWIVIDGESTDGTKEYIEINNRIIKKWISEKDQGIYDAMNKGIQISNGQYIVFMNAGDMFSDSGVLGLVSDHLMFNNSDVDVILGGAMLVFDNNIKIYRAPRNIDSYLWHGLPAYHQATYYKRERVQNTPYDLKYNICGDYYIISKLFMEGLKEIYIDKSLVDFRMGDMSYRNPYKLFAEPYDIQKEVLNLSFRTRCMSLIKRLVSFISYILVSALSKIKFLNMYKIISKS